MLPQSDGKWRSPNQHSLVAHVLEGLRDVLAVLPTGVGKSLAFLIPAVVQGKTILVIVPLVALKHDLARRCRALNIGHCNWSPSLSVGGATSIVLVSIESVGSQEYARFARALHAADKLLCVVVDEAHLLFHTYRYVLCQHPIIPVHYFL